MPPFSILTLLTGWQKGHTTKFCSKKAYFWGPLPCRNSWKNWPLKQEEENSTVTDQLAWCKYKWRIQHTTDSYKKFHISDQECRCPDSETQCHECSVAHRQSSCHVMGGLQGRYESSEGNQWSLVECSQSHVPLRPPPHQRTHRCCWGWGRR